MPKSCERKKKKFGLKTSRRAPPLGGVGGYIYPKNPFVWFINHNDPLPIASMRLAYLPTFGLYLWYM